MTQESAGLPVLSASKFKTFSTCARRFYYDYVDKQVTKKHPAAVLGTAVHKTIERVHRGQSDAPIETFVELFNLELERPEVDLDKLKAQHKLDGIKMVSTYKYDRRKPNDMEVEFLLPFPNQAHALCQIHGYIDQTYDWGFVDLKTNGRKPYNSVLDNDLQFIVYDWAFKEIYGYEATNRIWQHLRTGEDLYADTPGKLDNAVRIVERILDAQITGIYDRTVSNETCGICSHRLICLGRAD